MKRYLTLAVAGLLILSGSTSANAGSSVNRTTEELGVGISWSNPSSKPKDGQVMNVKFKFTASDSGYDEFNVWMIQINDANGMEVAYKFNTGNIRPGKSGYLSLPIYGSDLSGTKAPYSVSFDIRGRILSPYETTTEISEYGFVFEVPTSITCAKKGKPSKKITAYKPKCPAGYTKK